MSEHKYYEGQFVWRELMTKDAERAKGFYGELCGWKFDSMPMPDGTLYTMAKLGDQPVGGLLQIGKEMGDMPSHWGSYVSVDDVDAAVARAKASGGKVVLGPEEVPGMVRFACLADPQGVRFWVVRSQNGDHVFERPPVGSFCWETLSTSDPEAAKTFYGKVLGWTVGPAPGDQGFVFKAASGAAACDVQKATNMPPGVLTYVVVDKVAAARTKAEKLGAKVLVPEISVPTVGLISVVADPTGAVIGLFQPEMS